MMDSLLPEVLHSPKMYAFKNRIDAFESSCYSTKFLEALQAIDDRVLYKSRLHGSLHIGRVVLFGAFIAMELKLDSDDTELLLQGCSYHDVGRVSDKIDDDHGRRSGEQIGKILGLPEGEPLHLLQAMVEAHSLDDNQIDAVLTRHSVQNRQRGKYLAWCLKDADALDRVRIAHLLDPSYLRLPCSKSLVPFAFRVFEVEAELLDAQIPAQNRPAVLGLALALGRHNQRVLGGAN